MSGGLAEFRVPRSSLNVSLDIWENAGRVTLFVFWANHMYTSLSIEMRHIQLDKMVCRWLAQNGKYMTRHAFSHNSFEKVWVIHGSFGARVSNLERLRRFCCDFLGASKKGPKNYQKSHQKGAFSEAVDMAQV